MDARDVERFRDQLLQQRRALLREISNVEEGLNHVAEERESEIEEQAQAERTARLLARLDDREKAELLDIDRALARMAAHRYGICTRCGAPIPLKRLAALPATPYCRDCAERVERGEPLAIQDLESRPRSGQLPPEYNLLTDRELEEAVRDHLREDARIDLDELRTVCRHGVVYLDGSIPSEAEHQIILHTVTDVLGLAEIVDRLRVTEILWERDDRSKPEAYPEPKPWEEPPGTTNVAESTEEGVEFEAPTDPGPDEE